MITILLRSRATGTPIKPGAVGATSDRCVAAWTPTDSLLYALGVGAGAIDALDPKELQFTTENSLGVVQRALPTLSLVFPLGAAEVLDAVGPLDWSKLVNAAQAIALHRPLPVEGHVEGRSRILGVHDKGSGALVVIEADASDVTTGEPMWTSRTSIFVRGAGGWDANRVRAPVDGNSPDRPPDHEVTYETRRDQALLYRLSGDRNPLHSDPKFARSAGYQLPILHGRCTLGFTARALVHTLCGSDPSRFLSVDARFMEPVIPGDTLDVAVWVTRPGAAAFRTTIGQGTAVLAGNCSFQA
jgi:acyl dehydratase